MTDSATYDLAAISETINAGQPVTPAEAAALVRAVSRTCRGPFLATAVVVSRLDAEARRLDAVAGKAKDEATVGLTLVEGKVESLGEEARAALAEQRAKALDDAAAARNLSGIVAKVGDIKLAATLLLRSGSEAGARRLGDFRHECGQDVNDMILAYPLDGEERQESCPRCRTAISFRAPRIRLTTDVEGAPGTVAGAESLR